MATDTPYTNRLNIATQTPYLKASNSRLALHIWGLENHASHSLAEGFKLTSHNEQLNSSYLELTLCNWRLQIRFVSALGKTLSGGQSITSNYVERFAPLWGHPSTEETEICLLLI